MSSVKIRPARHLPKARPHSTSANPTILANAEYFSILARATNDALRDWNVKTGALAWHHGLESLLGAGTSAATGKIAFWLERIHPEDRARIQESIHQALAGPDEHWTGEYRFQHGDGRWLHILERALIVRSPDPRVVGAIDGCERTEAAPDKSLSLAADGSFRSARRRRGARF